MRKVPKGPEPAQLQFANKQGVEYPDWGGNISPFVRKALAADQAERCAYCERSLRLGAHHKTKIEHFHPRANEPWERRSVRDWSGSACKRESGSRSHQASNSTWANLLLACQGTGTERTCDTSKGATDICSDFRNPAKTHHEQLVEIQRGGYAVPASGMPTGAAKVVDEVLNLNAASLREERKTVMDEYIVLFNKKKSELKGPVPDSEKRALATRIRRQANKPGRSFPSSLISVAREIENKIKTR